MTCKKMGKALVVITHDSRIARMADRQFQIVDGDEKAAEKFFGEYMLEYSWAEERMALLSKYI